MVDADSRNNAIVVAVIIAVAIMVTAFIYLFATSILQVAHHGEETMNSVGTSLIGNISNATEVNQMNLMQFNKSMTDVIQSNDRIVDANNQSLANLSKIVHNFSSANTAYLNVVKNNTGFNGLILAKILATLQSIDKKLDLLPVTPIPQTNQSCTIKTPKVCILPNSGGIVINH